MVRRLLIPVLLAVVLVFATLGLPAQAAEVRPPTATDKGASAESPGKSAGEKSTGRARRERREGPDVRLHLRGRDLTVTVDGGSLTRYRVGLRGLGVLTPIAAVRRVTTNARGHAVMRATVDRAPGNRGGVIARVEGGGGASSRSVWTHRVRGQRWVVRGTELGSQLAAIRARHGDRATRQAAFARLRTAPDGATTVRTSALAAGSEDIEITGTIRWQDSYGSLNPARHVIVDITDLDGAFGPMLVQRVETDARGQFSYTYTPADTTPPDRDIQIEVFAEDFEDVARVLFPAFDYRTHSQITFARGVDYGESVDVSLDMGDDSAFEQAFAIHDALWSAHQFAELVGDGEEDEVPVWFPYGDDDHAAVAGNLMEVGAFEWSAWEVLNHEYGHWYDRAHDISGLVGGKHCATPLSAVPAPCDPSDPYNYDKDKGTQLAWSEGFATFFAQGAALQTPVPLSLSQQLRTEIMDGDYDDTWTEADGTHRNEPTFPASRGSGDAEDDESAVAGVLRGVLDKEGATTAMDLVKGADALRLDDFTDHVWEADGSTLLQDAEDFGCSLESSSIAPNLGIVGREARLVAPTLTWSAGNAGAHENDRFVVEAFDVDGTFPHFTSQALTGTSWQPNAREWAEMVRGRGEIELRVTGWNDSEPATGPFRGCREDALIDDAPSPLDTQSCDDVTLPPNDDGSTGAVSLPFAPNFFGTTYTELFVNNNGNVTFDAPLGTYTPFTLDANTPPIIAPFFADVDTRGAGSAPVEYSYGSTTFRGRDAFCVNWFNVGYYSRPLRQAELLPAVAGRPVRPRPGRLRHRVQLRRHHLGDR